MNNVTLIASPQRIRGLTADMIYIDDFSFREDRKLTQADRALRRLDSARKCARTERRFKYWLGVYKSHAGHLPVWWQNRPWRVRVRQSERHLILENWSPVR